MAAARPTAHKFALEVAGFNVGMLKKFTGLGLRADIVASPPAAGDAGAKHVANVSWTPGRASVGHGMGKGMYEWITASMNKSRDPRSGVFTTADANATVQSTLTFTDAVITEITVPRLDAASRDTAWIEVVFEAAQVLWAAGRGEKLAQGATPKAKAWLSSNYRLTIGDLPCMRVAAIESFTWRCAAVSPPAGVLRSDGPLATVASVPDLVLTISGVDYAAWAEAARKWFVDGNHLSESEMDGRLVFLGPDLKEELGAIDLRRVGFKGFEHPESVLNSERTDRFSVTLYVEQMQLSIKALDP